LISIFRILSTAVDIHHLILMEVKIDTREKFHVITIKQPAFAANMTADLNKTILPLLQNDVKNVVFNLKDIQTIDIAAAENLVKLQQMYYEQNASFVVCEMRQAVEESLEQASLLEMMNVTPTEREAVDVVMMEEIERELLDEE
jgi:anti-anti-sigma factor